MLSEVNFYCIGEITEKDGKKFCTCVISDREEYQLPLMDDTPVGRSILVEVDAYPGEEGNSYFFKAISVVRWKERFLVADDKKNYCFSTTGERYYITDTAYMQLKEKLYAKVIVPSVSTQSGVKSSAIVVLPENTIFDWNTSFSSSALVNIASRLFYDGEISTREVWRKIFISLSKEKRCKLLLDENAETSSSTSTHENELDYNTESGKYMFHSIQL